MSSSHKDDRLALMALCAILTAIVFVSFFEIGARQPTNNWVVQQQGHQLGEDDSGELAVPATSQIWGDTYPQWIMAVFAFAATLVSWRALVLIRLTFKETERTARAAIRANEIAQEGAIQQLRAYVELPKSPLQIWQLEVSSKPA